MTSSSPEASMSILDHLRELRGRLLEHKPKDGERPARVEMYRMGG